MCECLSYDDGSMHLCEACVVMMRDTNEEVERLRKTERAVVKWWESLRPGSWTVKKHLEVPFANCTGIADRRLAQVAAATVRREQRMEKLMRRVLGLHQKEVRRG